MRYLRILLLGLLALVMLVAEPTPSVHAATFTVTKTADTNDGVCDTDCSLREAISAANALAGADIVNLPAGTYTLAIAGIGEDANASGDLDITAELTIVGAGAATTIIDGGGLDRVFDILVTPVNISGVTIQGGADGGISIESGGTLTLSSSTVSGNTASRGGGIDNFGTATLTNVTISGNTSAIGGGINNRGVPPPAAIATLTNVTVSGNTATDFGGGIFNGPDAALTVSNSTVSGNTADRGGGIDNSGTVTLTNVTLSGNFAGSFGSGISNAGTAALKNTIVANFITSGNCSGPVTSSGYNLSSDGTCAFGAAGDMNNTDPLLGSLADNGGPTFTVALLKGSPAADAASPDCPPPNTDQRGIPRPQGPRCDIGAYEADDTDGDGVVDPIDNCPLAANPSQTDTDADGRGDACDNCPNTPNAGQENNVHPGTPEGDACDDPDSDTVFDITDNCPDTPNPGQENADGDPFGDACETPDCIAVPTAWPAPTGDQDCDGWTTSLENSIGTDPNDACADTTTVNDERGPGFGEPLSPWPPDVDDNRVVNITDVGTMRPPVFNLLLGRDTIPANPSYEQRLDMNNDGFIDITDINAMRPPIFNLLVPCTP